MSLQQDKNNTAHVHWKVAQATSTWQNIRHIAEIWLSPKCHGLDERRFFLRIAHRFDSSIGWTNGTLALLLVVSCFAHSKKCTSASQSCPRWSLTAQKDKQNLTTGLWHYCLSQEQVPHQSFVPYSWHNRLRQTVNQQCRYTYCHTLNCEGMRSRSRGKRSRIASFIASSTCTGA